MARARNIKPGFFTNEVLAELGFGTRLLFIGLWTLADRDGRLEYRARKIRAALFPYDSDDAANVESGIESLAKLGFLCVYEHGGNLVIQIANWEKHQRPHPREAPSELPPPIGHNLGAAEAKPGHVPARLIPDCLHSHSLQSDTKNKGREKAAPLVLPSWLDVDAWADWHNYRNSRKGWTAKAKALSLRTLDKLHSLGHDPRAVIERSIERGWTGLFPPDSTGYRGNGNGNSAVERVQRNNQRAADRET